MISGRTFSGTGVEIQSAGTTGNVVQGNLIGLASDGSTALACRIGVEITSSATGNLIGGDDAADGSLDGQVQARNVIVALDGAGGGIGIELDSGGNQVQGNDIGTDRSGSFVPSLPGPYNYTYCGVTTDGGNTIGGSTAGAGNVIAGCWYGLFLGFSTLSGSVVQGNFIGTNATGTAALPNLVGIELDASNCTIGGTITASRNIISGNTYGGIEITGAGATGNVLLGNYIGTDAAGTGALANGNEGVLIGSGASNNTIGGTTAGARNVISGNQGAGIQIDGDGTSGNVVAGNFIGTDVTGTQDLANSQDGVLIQDVASGNTIGGTTAGARNVISGNSLAGVHITDTGTTGNVVAGNFIGTDVTGTAAMGNAAHGVLIQDAAANNTIGGTSPGAGNTIADNGGAGVDIDGSATTGNAVRGNSIYNNTGPGIQLTNGAVAFSNEYPTVTLLDAGTASTPIQGTFQGVPNTSYQVDFFGNDPHAAGNTAPYDGQHYLGSVVAATDTTGQAFFKAALPGASSADQIFTATVTVAGWNTSPFSILTQQQPTATYTPPTVTVDGPADTIVGIPVAFTSVVTDVNSVQPTLTYQWSVTSPGFSLPTAVVTNEPAFTFTPTTLGTYTVQLTVTDENGFVQSHDEDLKVGTPGPGAFISGPAVNGTLSPAPVLATAGTAVTLQGNLAGTAGVTPSSYTWAVTLNGQPYNPGTPTNLQTFSFTPTQNGLYDVTLTVTDTSGGVSTSNVYVVASGGAPSASIVGALRLGRKGSPSSWPTAAPMSAQSDY